MQFAIVNENKITVTGRNLTVTPTAEGITISVPCAGEQLSFPKTDGAKRGRKPKMQEGVLTPSGAVPGPKVDGYSA